MRIDRVTWYTRAARKLGPISLIRLQLQKRYGSNQQLQKLTSRLLRHPVYARPGSSDLVVFDQIFVHCEYRCLDDLTDPKLILDCGANVGYSSTYFLSKFPGCFVVAVEPDPSNFEMLQRNLLPYEGRYTLIRAAVWPRAELLRFNKTVAGLGREWARRVEPADCDTMDDIETIDIPGLIARSPYKRVSLLKVDIEGAETELFGSEPRTWLRLVDNIVIELHGDVAKKSFFDAIDEKRFNISICDELTVCLSDDFRR
jgi:FkbM family methyltransferase